MEVEINGLGIVRGIVRGTGGDAVAVFRGVPYAEPASGRRRFGPALPKQAWSGVLDCTRDRPNAPQTESRVFAALGDADNAAADIGEDCLNLTIWAPPGAVRAPVMFWIHGGAFMTGGGAWPWYDGERIAREHGIVVVGVNYRVGAMGYLSVPGKVEANAGLRDQIVALEWLRDHIADFGGDADNVTVAGQSAGAHSIIMYFGLPETRGLFRRAILQSPPAGLAPRPVAEAQRWTRPFLAALGLSGEENDLLDRLGAMPLARILGAQGAAAAANPPAPGNIEPPFVPVGDRGQSQPETFIESMAREAASRRVDLLLGWTRDEAALFTHGNPGPDGCTEAELRDFAHANFGERADIVLAEARARRPGAGLHILYDELIGELYFRDGSIRFAEEVVAAGGTISVYHFAWNTAGGLRACHCAELPFTFGNLAAWRDAAMMAGQDAATLEPLATAVSGHWARFVRTGNAGLTPWSNERRDVLFIESSVSVRQVGDPALL